MEPTFNRANVDALSNTCQKIQTLSKEAIDGKFMATQLMFLGALITEFADNPIVANSGLVTSKVK